MEGNRFTMVVVDLDYSRLFIGYSGTVYFASHR